MKLSFVIPCYNSEKSIENVISRIDQTVLEDGRFEYEIICINDCSLDNTYLLLKQLTKRYPLKALSLSRNYGQHAALMAGFRFVTGDYVICMDDDGQNPPEYVSSLVDKLEEGYDFVSVKYSKEKRGVIRELGTRVSIAMSRHLVGMPKDIEINSYMIFRRYICDEIIKYENPYPFVAGLILRVTRNMANIEITRQERISGKSGYSFLKLLSLLMNGFTAFSEIPLRIASGIGIIFSAIGFIFAVIIIIQKLLDPSIAAGYTSTIAVLLIMGGMIMVSLGLLGEYIGRMYISINKAPQYVIKESENIKKENENE